MDSDGDFLLVQNYIVQLCAERKITSSDFLLYCFYRSISGFSEIKCGYDYISLNTGLSTGAISSGNKKLLQEGLIKIRKNGEHRSFHVILSNGNELPRRKLKKITKEFKEELIVEENIVKESFKKITKYNLYDYKPSIEILKFIEKFVDEWCDRNKAGFYYKNDYNKLEEIDVEDAIKYIPVLWDLGKIDNWVNSSDYTISIFVKEFKEGKLQSLYPKTRYYYLDKQKKEKE